MTDSTSKICLYCNEEFTDNNRKYCTFEHQTAHYNEESRKRRKELSDKLKKTMWKVNVMERYNKFYELFGKDSTCSICGCTYEQNLNKHGVPLHPRLTELVQDYRVLDPSLWQFYCFKCYVEITFLKENIQT